MKAEHKEEGFRRGIRVSSIFRTPGAKVVGEQNLLGVPLCALSARQNTTAITSTWESGGVKSEFRFQSVSTPFPIAAHCQILDALIGLFAHNFRADGKLLYKKSHIAEVVGAKVSAGFRKSCIEAVNRYAGCNVTWKQSWIGGKVATWTGPLIVYSSEEGLNPGNGGSAETWHEVMFHPMLVESLQNRGQRLIVKEAMIRLPSDVYLLYRYLKRFDDRKPIFRTVEQLRCALGARSRKEKFRNWLAHKLDVMQTEGFIHDFTINDNVVKVTMRKEMRLVRQRSLPDGSLRDADTF